MVIMIDAGLKLEGETVGEVSEGIGAAIGGPGVDQFKIEAKLTKYQIPINAVIIKEDIGDAVSPMRKEINDAVDTFANASRTVAVGIDGSLVMAYQGVMPKKASKTLTVEAMAMTTMA